MNTYTKEINGIKYTIKVDDMLYFQSQALWRAISDIPVGRLKDGFKIQIGFSLYILQKAISGYCIVTPDYEPPKSLNLCKQILGLTIEPLATAILSSNLIVSPLI